MCAIKSITIKKRMCEVCVGAKRSALKFLLEFYRYHVINNIRRITKFV